MTSNAFDPFARPAFAWAIERNCVAWIVFSVSLCAGLGAPDSVGAQSGTPKQSAMGFAQYQANMDKTSQQVDRMIASLDQSRFELKPLLDRLDFDAETIVEFVSDQIVFQQYPGVLRGAKGTLMSMAGNSLDQSLLLATLLRTAGFDARIVEGRLSESQALQLMGAMENPVRTGFSSAEVEALLGEISQFKSSKKQSQLGAQLRSSLEGETRIADPDLLQQLGARNLEVIQSLTEMDVSLDLGPVPQSILEEAAQYFWVEYSRDSSNTWVRVHPIFHELPDSFSTLTAVEYFASSIPEEYQQRITISVEIEQSINGEKQVHQVLSPWSRPAASLYGKELFFTNIPLNFTGSSSPTSQDASVEAAEFFMPVLDGAPATSSLVFDLRGNIAPPDAAIDPASGVIKQVGEKMGVASAALQAATSSDGSSIGDHLPKLVSQKVQIELQVPGRAARTFTKSLISGNLKTFDDSGEPTMALKDALTAQLTFGFALGDYPDQFVLFELLNRIKNMRPVFDAIFGSILATDETELWEKSRFASVPTTWGRMPTLVRLMHAAEMPAGTLAYFGEPGVIVHQVRRDRYRDIEGSLDILTNTRRVFDISNSVPRIDPNSQARLGVWDTNMEELFYRRSQLAASKDAESPQPGRGSLITSASELTLNEHSDYKEAYRSMKRDLESGFTLFVPERQFGTEPVLVAWWRVNKVTGEMLGIVADGSGGVASVLPLSVEIPEWLIKLVVSWGMTAAFAAAGYQDCVQATHEERCCAEFAAGWAVVGGLAGIVVTAQVLWELTIMQLYWMELTINGGLGLYGSQEFFNELCQTAIFGDNSNPQDFWPIPESQMAWMESGITGHPKTACLGSVY